MPGLVVVALSLWVAFASTVAFWYTVRDKMAAMMGTWRVPEATLFWWELVGGSFGGLLARTCVCHKTRKRSFQGMVTAIHVVQAIVVGIIFFSWL